MALVVRPFGLRVGTCYALAELLISASLKMVCGEGETVLTIPPAHVSVRT